MVRDSQRMKVLLSIVELGYEYKVIPGEIQSYYDQLLASRWYLDYEIPVMDKEREYELGRRKPRSMAVFFSKRDKGRVFRSGDYSRVNPRVGYRKEAEALKWFAYCMLTETPWHGRQFCRVYLDLVKHKMGLEAYRTVLQEFRKRRVKYTAKRGKLTKLNSAQEAVRLRGRMMKSLKISPRIFRKDGGKKNGEAGAGAAVGSPG